LAFALDELLDDDEGMERKEALREAGIPDTTVYEA
jgi:hypothetical protein